MSQKKQFGPTVNVKVTKEMKDLIIRVAQEEELQPSDIVRRWLRESAMPYLTEEKGESDK